MLIGPTVGCLVSQNGHQLAKFAFGLFKWSTDDAAESVSKTQLTRMCISWLLYESRMAIVGLNESALYQSFRYQTHDIRTGRS